MFPCDEVSRPTQMARLPLNAGPQAEMDRMDIMHKLFLVARHEELHKSPLVANSDGLRILDVGTGTGIWAIDMAESVPLHVCMEKT